MKQTQNRIAQRHRWAVFFICVAVVVIVALDVLCALCTSTELVNKLFGINLQTAPVTKEEAYLGNALSIIGIAISVWAALNIVNALDKNDVEVLQEQLIHLRSETISEIAVQHRNTLFQLFEQCSVDVGMKYIAKKFKYISDLPCNQLAIVMHYFKRVYDLHHNEQDKSPLYAAVITDSIDYINSILSNEEIVHNNIVSLFLHYCLAEILFYRAYIDTDTNRHLYSLQALQEYNTALPLFEIQIPPYDQKFIDKYPDSNSIDQPYNSMNRELFAYLCNTYGECYSKLGRAKKQRSTDKEEIQSYLNKAVFYCEYAVTFSNEQNETYLRNLGCALEAAYPQFIKNRKICEKIYQVYEKAITFSWDTDYNSNKAFYVWLSFYHKYFDNAIVPALSKQLMNVNIKPTDETVQFCHRALLISDIAQKKHPNRIVFTKYHAFVLRDLCRCYIHLGAIPKAKEYFSQYKNIYHTLLVLCSEQQDKWDPFMTNIHKDFIYLENHLKQLQYKP